MVLKFKVNVEKTNWLKLDRQREPIANAAVAALEATANNSVKAGRANIATAGLGFQHAQWMSGLKYRMENATKGGEATLNPKAIVFHKYGIAGVFEYGATIEGKPLLWIPTQHGAPPASRSGKKLTSATIRGQPVLFDASDHDRHRKPLYVGVPSIRIPKKWRITEIVQQHVAQIGLLFIKYF